MGIARTTPALRIHPALHIDVFLESRRIAEEMFDRRREISVGRERGNTIVLPDEQAPRSLPLFHRSPTGYLLHYTDDMHGSVAPTSGAVWLDLSELRSTATAHRHGYDLDLPEGARGRIDIGDERLEFELVAGTEPLVKPRRWPAVMVGVVIALALAALFSWALTRPAPPPPFAPPTPVTPPRSAVVLPVAPAAPTIRLPPVTVRARPSAAPARRRGEVALTGSLRVIGTSFPAPKLDQVATPPRTAEWSTGPSRYTADGVLRPEVVAQEIAAEKGGLAAAYQRALKDDPQLAGVMVARIAVGTHGGVSRVVIVRDTVGSPALRRRLESFLSAWRSPLPTAAPAEYELPFQFRSTK